MPRLTAAERERAVGMSQVGASNSHIARTLGCTRQTIIRLLRRVNQTGQTSDRPRSGRPRVTTPAEDRYIRTLHLRNRFLTMASTASTALGHHISRNTVMRRLRAAGIRAYRPFRGMTLTAQHRISRLRWARRDRRWQRRDWSLVLFTDESRFNLYHADGRVRVYRRRGERLAGACVQQVHPFGGGSVMVWGGICGEQKTDLVILHQTLTAQRYRDQVLQPVVIPFMQRQRQGLLFQQDNARPHTARLTMDFLNRQNIQLLPWPSRSPDLSPIEHLWDHLGRQLRRRAQPPTTIPQLEQALREEWQRIPNDVIRRLTFSMRRRVLACINSNGGHTRY